MGGAGVYPQNFNSKKRSKEMVQVNNYAALPLQEWITCLDEKFQWDMRGRVGLLPITVGRISNSRTAAVFKHK